MIFSTIDLLQYLLRRGKYGDNQKDGGMSLAFIERIPGEIIEQMNEGDMIFTQRLNSLMSWAMMYLTSSPVDHAGIYAGDGKIFHMTLRGTKLHSLQSVAKGARILIVRMGIESKEWIRISNEQMARTDKGNVFIHSFPPKIQLIFVAISILTLKYPDRINQRIILDTIAFLISLYAVVFAILGTHLMIAPLCLYILMIVLNITCHMRRKGRGEGAIMMSHPDNAYAAFYQSGGMMFTTIGPIVCSGLGFLPLKVVFRLARKRPNDCSDDKLEIASQFFCDLIEGWNLHPKTKQAEDDDGEKHKN